MARILDDTGLIAIGVDRSVWLDARGEDGPGPLVGPRPASMGSWSGPPTRRTVPAKYCQSRTRVSVSDPLVRRQHWRVEEPSPWSRSSCTFLPGRTVGREHRPNSRSVHVHSAAILTHRRAVAVAHSACLSRPPERMWTDAAYPRPPPQGGPESMTPPETVSTTASGDAHATAPLACTFGPQGPTLGDLIDAYLQDYQVRQFRSVSTARGRTAHLAAFFGRAARAAGFTTHQIRQYQLARRAAGAATGTINRETSALHRMGPLAVHWG